MTTFLLLAIGSAALGVGDGEPPTTFQIESPAQTPHSVLLVWETDQDVRTLKSAMGWSPSTPTGPTHRVEIVARQGRDGSTAAKIEGSSSENNARGCFVQHLENLRQPGSYDYSLFYRTTEKGQGTARVLIDCYVGQGREHQGLVSQDVSGSETWAELTGTFELPDDVQLTRILLYRVGAGTAWFDDVRISAAGSTANFVNNSRFDGTHSWRVSFRSKGDQPWQAVDAVVLERFHNVIFLEPKTEYEFKVQRISAKGEVESQSQVLSAATSSVQPRVWQGLAWGPDQRTPTPPSVYPCLESVDGELYFCDSRGGVLWLTALDEDFQARWTKRWVEPFPVDGRPCYQGQTQTAVLGRKLYVSWKRAHHGDAPHARQCVASYDTESGQIGQPLVIEPDDPKESTWNGGIAALDGQLWVSYCRWRPDDEGYKTTVTVRRLDYEAGKLGPAFELDPQPTETPYTPFLSVFKGQLVVCFTESQAKTDMQPLYLVRFDGERFHDLMTVSPDGYNQYAKGVEHGEKLLLLWKYGAPYPSRIYGRYMFHDIGMALVDPVAKTVQMTSLVDDFKYNSSPDVTYHNGRFIYTYNKFEHLYGTSEDPGKLHGCFMGVIAPNGTEQ